METKGIMSARYSVSVKCFFRPLYAEAQTIRILADTSFIQDVVWNKEKMCIFLSEKLKTDVFSYTVESLMCIDVTDLENKIATLEKKVLQLEKGKEPEALPVPTPKVPTQPDSEVDSST